MTSWCAAVLLACCLAAVVASQHSTAESAWEDHDGTVLAGIASADYDRDKEYAGYKDIQIVQGPVGPTGADGAPGATGATGSDGKEGATGPPGPPGKCINCGICPSDTSANDWELGAAQFSQQCIFCGFDTTKPCFPIGPGGQSGTVGLSKADCGQGNTQIGGACESFCIYYNGYSDLGCGNGATGYFAVGYFPDTTFTTNGWSAAGQDSGTYCGLSTNKEFAYYDTTVPARPVAQYFFVCASLPWRKCCRPTDFSEYTNPLSCSKGDYVSPDPYSYYKHTAPSVPGSLQALPKVVVTDVAAYDPTNPPTTAVLNQPYVPCWVKKFLATAAPYTKFPWSP